MQPLRLTLKGFRGIRDGLGLSELTLDLERLAGDAQLIAIAGPNGCGKTTVMDNLTPYNLLASRAAGGGPGGFSYYDHVYLPENVKDLVWAHEGHCYRSQIVIRLNGRRRTEAFLHRLHDNGSWRPVALDDGTLSDGRMESYTACVEHICGSAETFFTSVFAPQGRRQLNTYRNAEIKSLLADLLGQEEIHRIGQRAGEVVRQLKIGLGLLRQEQAVLEAESDRIEAAKRRLDGASARVDQAESDKLAAQSALDAALERHARLAAEFEQQRGTELRRFQLQADRLAEMEASTQSIRALRAQETAASLRLERLECRVLERQQQARTRRQSLVQSRRRCLSELAQAAAVDRAARRLALAQRVHEARRSVVLACRAQVQALNQEYSAVRLAEQKLTAVEREAGKAVLRTEELAHRFGLTSEVPCAGTGLQGRCKLLGDAHEAKAVLPDARVLVMRCARQKSEVQREFARARQKCQALAGAPQWLAWAEHREAVAGGRAGLLAALAAQSSACAQAEAMLADVEREMAALGPDSHEELPTPEEQAEYGQIAESRRAIARQVDQEMRRSDAALARIDQALALLSAGCDELQLGTAAQAVNRAREVLNSAQCRLLEAVREAQTDDELGKQAVAIVAQRVQGGAQRAKIENEIANWTLLARCMSNDGLIALAIDDAGPALSGLANDLLLACYGPRFTVAIHTLLETSKGDQREGFDIVVHDGVTSDAKSVGLMSGGEKTWIESCLTRAIALYLAMHTGRRYTTLFTDEADGALDIERKRMFMAMKREVLRLGGYEREYFVSQTPELTAMADAVIDLNALKVGPGEAAVIVAE
ncbi:MAG: DNA repair protein [Delftia acidovorans]|nr:MAG: DNA repair protein [Delftia acidovorans]